MAASEYRRQGAEWRVIVVADDEFDYVETWFYDTLSGSTDLMALLPGGIVQGNVAPEGTAYPFVSISFVTAEEDFSSLSGPPHAILRYLITVWVEGESYEPAATPNALIKALLHDQDDNDGTTGIVSCRRVNPWREDIEEG